MDQLDHKNILIVGGTSGIGASLLDQLIDSKANIYMVSRQKPDSKIKDKVKHFTLDVLDDNYVLEGLPDVLHGLVYLPGTINLKPFQSLKPEDFRQDFEVNVLGAVKIIQQCLSALKKAKGASIVLFSTVAVQVGLNYHASVAAAKGALEALGRSLAAEYSSKQIRVNLIAPSLTDTPLAKNLLSSEEKQEASAQRHPLGRYGRAEDIANMAYYLLTEQSSWISGQVFHIDGGMSSIKKL